MWTNYAYTENNLQKSHSEAEKAMDGGQGHVHKWSENLDSYILLKNVNKVQKHCIPLFCTTSFLFKWLVNSNFVLCPNCACLPLNNLLTQCCKCWDS